MRQGATVAHVAVLSNDSNIYMPIMNDRPVRFADEAGIHTALGIDQVPLQHRAPLVSSICPTEPRPLFIWMAAIF